MADINATDLTQETTTTMDGTEQFVMFDSAEGKRATIAAVGDYIIEKLGLSLNGKTQTVAAALASLNSDRKLKATSLCAWTNAKSVGDTFPLSDMSNYNLFLFISGGANGYTSYITTSGYLNTSTNKHFIGGSKADGTEGTITFHVENQTVIIDSSDCAYGIRQVNGLYC